MPRPCRTYRWLFTLQEQICGVWKRYLCQRVALLGRALGLAGRVAEGKDDWLLIEGSHIPNDLLGEGSSNRCHTWDKETSLSLPPLSNHQLDRPTYDGCGLQFPNHILQFLHLRVLVSKPLLLVSQMFSALMSWRQDDHAGDQKKTLNHRWKQQTCWWSTCFFPPPCWKNVEASPSSLEKHRRECAEDRWDGRVRGAPLAEKKEE